MNTRMILVTTLAMLALAAGPTRAADLAIENGFTDAEVDTAVTVGGGWRLFFWGSSVSGNPFTWTSTEATVLRITDAFCFGDQFTVSVVPGPTLMPTPDETSEPGSTACGGPSSPDPAYAHPDMSHGCWIVGPGPQSLTIGLAANPFGGGAGYLRVDTLASNPSLGLSCVGV